MSSTLQSSALPIGISEGEMHFVDIEFYQINHSGPPCVVSWLREEFC